MELATRFALRLSTPARASVLWGICLTIVGMGVVVPAAEAGQFAFSCGYSHSLKDDPIVAPGQATIGANEPSTGPKAIHLVDASESSSKAAVVVDFVVVFPLKL